MCKHLLKNIVCKKIFKSHMICGWGRYMRMCNLSVYIQMNPLKMKPQGDWPLANSSSDETRFSSRTIFQTKFFETLTIRICMGYFLAAHMFRKETFSLNLSEKLEYHCVKHTFFFLRWLVSLTHCILLC